MGRAGTNSPRTTLQRSNEAPTVGLAAPSSLNRSIKHRTLTTVGTKATCFCELQVHLTLDSIGIAKLRTATFGGNGSEEIRTRGTCY